MHRRQLLAGSALLAAIPFAGARAQQMDASATTPQVVEAQTFTVGDARVTALSDGWIRLGVESLRDITDNVFSQLMADAYADPETYVSGINAYLIERDGQMMLVDAGTGGSMGGTGGRTLDQLAGLGIDPADITHLLATHLHPDHIGGAAMEGAATFPNATLVVHEQERAYWGNPANASQGNPEFFRMAQEVLGLYDGRIEEFSEETEIARGITAIPLPGHTPGHSGFRIDGDPEAEEDSEAAEEQDRLLIWADIVHVAPVQLARPEVTIGFDVDPPQAARTRIDILERVASERLRIAGSHIPFPGVGNIAPMDQGYRFVAANYPYAS